MSGDKQWNATVSCAPEDNGGPVAPGPFCSPVLNARAGAAKVSSKIAPTANNKSRRFNTLLSSLWGEKNAQDPTLRYIAAYTVTVAAIAHICQMAHLFTQ